MSTPNRAQILNAAIKVLRKHYDPVRSTSQRTVLEHLIYGLCLENSPYDKADEAFARLEETFFDWNEVRVTTVTELTEVCRGLPFAASAASNIRRALHSIFESQFSFDLEPLKKENIGKTVKQLEKHDGITPFAVGHLVQHGLGGHAIPIDNALVMTMLVLGVITEPEAEKKMIPGVERAIPKSKGIEMGSLLHQLAADFFSSPRSPRMRSLILEIDPMAKDRLPKRSTKKADLSAQVKSSSGEKSTPQTAPPARAPSAAKTPSKKSAKPAGTDKKKPKAKSDNVAPAAKKKSDTRRLTKRKPR